MLQRRFWIIILFVIFATGGGVFWYWKSTVQYSSVARTHIYFQNPNVSIIGNEGFTTSSAIQSHDELLKSENVLKKTAIEIRKIIDESIQKQNIAAAKESQNQTTDETAPENLVKENENKDDKEELEGDKAFAHLESLKVPQIVNHLMKSIDVARDKDDKNIFQISYTCPNRNDCHIILGMVIDNYEKHLVNKYQSEGKELVLRIEKAQGDIKDDIDEVTKEYNHWQNVTEKEKLAAVETGIIISKEGKSNGFRAEAQVLYEEISALKRERQKLVDDQQWIESAIAAKMNPQEILTHIDKFSEWLQIEERKMQSKKAEGLLTKWFEEPVHSADLIQARFAVTQKEGEIQNLIDKGFGENYPGRRTLDRELEDIKNRVKLLEDYHQERVALAKKRFEESNKLVNEQKEKQAENKLPEILNDIDLIGLHKSYIAQKLARANIEIQQLEAQHLAKLAGAKEVDRLLQKEREYLKKIAMMESLNQTVVSKIKEINLEKDNGGYVLDIINNPSYASQTEPSMVKIFAITTFLGMLLGTGLAYLVEIADKTFRSPAEIAQQLGMQVIGHVPVLSTKKVNAKSSAMDESLVAFHLPKSQQSEAFRAIRTSLFFNAQGKNSQIIQVTSPTPGDGKSTLAANLAISLAQSGKRVLIVDSDLRRPTVHYLFGTDSDIGFAAVLNGDCEIEDAIVDSEVDGLSIMPAGSRPSNPAELLTSSHLYDLFEVLREKFDFIVMDSPPMLAVTDPTAVAARADGVILALRIKKNVKLSASRAKEVLDSVGAKIMGIVVNGAGMVQGNYSNSAAYGYGYGAGYSGNYYSYGYDYGESSYYYDDDHKPTTANR